MANLTTDARALLVFSVLTLLAGIVVLVLAGGLAMTVVAIVLLGLAGIALVALVFLRIGESEDEDRRRHPRG
jgi:heme/copper-type cytochrome/quinol oxidase subunit 4